MSLTEKFQQACLVPGQSVMVFLRDVAIELDGLIALLKERDDFESLPVLVPNDTPTWSKALASANGWGDVMNRISHMCQVLDNLKEWSEEHKGMTPAQQRMAHARAAKAAKHV